MYIKSESVTTIEAFTVEVKNKRYIHVITNITLAV